MNNESKDFKVIPKPRSKKLHPRIDLSSMVSISFLLIIFFMVTVELAKPQMMEFGTGDRGCGGGDPWCKPDQRGIVTLLLDDDNKIISYHGLLNYPEEPPKKVAYGGNGIRKEILRMDKAWEMVRGNDRNLIVLIKPSKKSNYGNLVDILDEMNITGVSYVIVNDFTPEEMKLLALN